MKNRIGSPVSGEDFFDREVISEKIWCYLESGSLLLLAPRRVGKTSLMKRLVEVQANKHGYQAIYLTVEGATDEADFVERLVRAVESLRIEQNNPLLSPVEKSPFYRFLKRINQVEAAGFSISLNDEAKQHWQDTVLALGNRLTEAKQPWLLAVDELPLFVLKLLKLDSSGIRASNFLHLLRELRQNQPEISWLLAGSIGLDTVTARFNMGDTINDLRMVELGPFDNDTAIAFLQVLAESYQIDVPESVCRYAVETIEWPLPYYLQLLFSELRELPDISDRPLNSADVDKAIHQLLEPAHKKYFDYWRQRLHEELDSPDDGHAILLLNLICQSAEGSERGLLAARLGEHINDSNLRDQRLRYLLDVLVNDGYLVESGARYRFRLPLLRQFWLKRVAQ